MKTLIILRILHLDPSDGILVLLEDDGSLPSVEIFGDPKALVLDKLREMIVSKYEDLWQNKVFSSIDGDSESVKIYFNMFLPSKSLSKKQLIRYNKNSIELQRFINHNRDKHE